MGVVMVYVLLYTLLLSNGTTVITHKDARTLHSYKHIKSLEHCNKLAKEQELRLLSSIIGNSRVVSVTVQCSKRKSVPLTKHKK